jgi:hypothetical protein
LKIILIIILVYFGLVLAGRYLFPALLRAYVKHISKKYYGDMESEKKNSAQKEGEVKISDDSGKSKKYPTQEGEYVDYEEIK